MYARDHARIATPIGLVQIEGSETAIDSIRIGADGNAVRGSATAVLRAAEQLESWFAGELRDFDLALAPPSTKRGIELRNGMIAIAYGDTLSYGALARQLGSSPRAIGQLCARNPFPIVVPCHRVLPGGGLLGNYSGGNGPVTKQWLLDHEQRHKGNQR